MKFAEVAFQKPNQSSLALFTLIIRAKVFAHALALQNLKNSLSTQTQHRNRKTSSLSTLSHALQETEGS